MPNLRDLLFGYEEPSELIPGEFSVYDTDITTASNGGACCLWTVPAGVSTAIFEIWSGGGGGGCGRCCQQGNGAGSGGYGIKVCTVAPGQSIRICAAGSTTCSNSCAGSQGNCSFVCSLGGSGESTWEAKVCGGNPNSAANCDYYGNCYTCCTMCYCCGGRSVNTDFSIPGTAGGGRTSRGCFDGGFYLRANAPFIPGPAIGRNGCCAHGGSIAFGMWPGGGGGTAQAFGGGQCGGGPGAGGLVYVVYF